MNTLKEQRSNIRRFGKIALLGLIFGAALALMFALTALAEEPPESTETPTTTELDTTATTVPDITTTTVPDTTTTTVLDTTTTTVPEDTTTTTVPDTTTTTVTDTEPVVDETTASGEEPVVDEESTAPEEEPAINEPATSALINTDKEDYAPGEVAQISGSGFVPNESVLIIITDNNGTTIFEQYVVADESGNVSTTFQVPEGKNFTLQAAGENSGASAGNSFTDCVISVSKTITSVQAPQNDFTITKDADPEGLDMLVSTDDEIEYTINVSNTGNNGQYSISGTITVQNNRPSNNWYYDYGRVYIDSVQDWVKYKVGSGGSYQNATSNISVDLSSGTTINWDATKTYTYSGTFSLPVDPSNVYIKNCVTVNEHYHYYEWWYWHTVTESASAEIYYGALPPIDNNVTVTDNEQLYLSDGITPSTDLSWTVTDAELWQGGVKQSDLTFDPSKNLDGSWTDSWNITVPVNSSKQIVIIKHIDATSVGNYVMQDTATTNKGDTSGPLDVPINIYFNISGYKYEDADGNPATLGVGAKLDNWIIELYKLDNLVEVLQGTATTGDTTKSWPTGYYEFANLGPGQYVVREQVQPGWQRIYPISGKYDIDSAIGTYGSLDFGNFEYAKICGYKFNDLNGDGIWDPVNEPGLQGWTITLTGIDSLEGVVNDSKVTDVNGRYCFENLWASDENGYTIAEVPQAGWTQTYPTPIPPGNYTNVIVTSGFGSWFICGESAVGGGGAGSRIYYNFGNYVPPSITTGGGPTPTGLVIAGVTTEKHKAAGIEVAGITELPFTGSNMLVVYAIAILMIISGTAILSTTKKTRKNRA